jgi:NADPH:quinone reductase-like Zn-dependent oxidoreductase
VSGISIGSRADQEDMIRAIDVNRIRPIVDRSFPLEEIAGAFSYYGLGQHFGKVCLNV